MVSASRHTLMKKSTPLCKKIFYKLRDEVGLVLKGDPSDYCIRRVYAGYWQRASGAWSWYLYSEKNHVHTIGSIYPAKQIAKAFFIGISNSSGDTEIYPYTKKEVERIVEAEKSKPQSSHCKEHGLMKQHLDRLIAKRQPERKPHEQ